MKIASTNNVAPVLGVATDEQSFTWKLAFACLLLLPWMLAVSRVGAEICSAFTGILFLFHSYRVREWSWLKERWVRIAFVAWLWLVLVVSPFAINPEKSILQALPWIRFIILCVAMRFWLLRSEPAIRWVGASLAALLILCSIDSAYQYVMGTSLTLHPIAINDRLTGPFTSPRIGIFMAKLLLPALAIGAILSLRRVTLAKYITLVGIVVCTAVIFLSGERTAFASTLFAIMSGSALVQYFHRPLLKPLLSIQLALVFVIAGLFITQTTAQNTAQRTLGHVEHFRSSPYGVVFESAIRAGVEYWPTGAGVQGFREVTQKHYNESPDKSKFGERYLHTHNPYLEWFAEAGLVGLILFIALVGTLLREALRLLKRARGTQVVVPAAMLGVWLMNFFPFMSTQSYFSNWAGILAWYAIGVVYSLSNQFASMASTHVTERTSQ